MHPDIHDYATSPITLIDLFAEASCVHTMFPRMNMVLHPVGKVKISSSNSSQKKKDLYYNCLLSPQDLGKYMDSMTAMEVVL